MRESHFFHKDEIVTILNEICDKTLGEVDKHGVFKKALDKPKITGIAGSVIEQSVFEYPADQDQRPDFDIDGILTELKTTGMRLKDQNGKKYFQAKEPASITAVSISSIVKEEFWNSKFWHKVAHLLFVFYHYESPKAVPARDYAKFHIKGYCFYSFTDDDVLILQKDWQLIHDFIEKIQKTYSEEEAKQEYPKLSTVINKKTVYLDTAPKYPHAPRFRLRKRVVSIIIQQHFYGETFEKVPGHYLDRDDIENKCAELTRIYRGYSMETILEHFGLSGKVALKQYAEQVIVRMFGGKAKKMSKIELFQKMGYIGKSVTVSCQENRTEDTKLFAVDFDELIEEWTDDDGMIREKRFEDSDLYSYLHDNKFLCMIFRENEQGANERVILKNNVFLGFKIIDLSDEDILSEAKRTWDEARDIVQKGELKLIPCLDKNGNQRYTPKTKLPMEAPNLPKARNHLIFFRGTGSDAADKVSIRGVKMLRQDYWIKGAYLVEKLKDIPYIQ